MSWVAAAVAGGTLVGGYLSSRSQSKAADKAADAQTQSAQLGIEEQRRQFDQIQQLLAPFIGAGNAALTGQKDLLGLNGSEVQDVAYREIEASPAFAALAQQGEEAILANASATGGLRGGNTQGALAQFRPQLLAQLIDQQYSRLGGLTQIGQASAAGVGAAGQESGHAVTKLLQQQGAASAGAALTAGKAQSQFATDATSALTNFIGKKF